MLERDHLASTMCSCSLLIRHLSPCSPHATCVNAFSRSKHDKSAAMSVACCTPYMHFACTTGSGHLLLSSACLTLLSLCAVCSWLRRFEQQLSALGLPGLSASVAAMETGDVDDLGCRCHAAFTVLLTQDERARGAATWPNGGAWTAAKKGLLEALEVAFRVVSLRHLN